MNNIQLLLCKINKVTAPFRHGQKVPNRALTDLSNFQIEFEQQLKSEELTKGHTCKCGNKFIHHFFLPEELQHLTNEKLCGSCILKKINELKQPQFIKLSTFNKNCEHCKDDINNLCEQCNKTIICENCYKIIQPYEEDNLYKIYTCSECAKQFPDQQTLRL